MPHTSQNTRLSPLTAPSAAHLTDCVPSGSHLPGLSVSARTVFTPASLVYSDKLLNSGNSICPEINFVNPVLFLSIHFQSTLDNLTECSCFNLMSARYITAGLLFYSYSLDLAENSFGDFFYRNAASCRFAREIFSIDFVKRGKISDIGQEAGGFDHFI